MFVELPANNREEIQISIFDLSGRRLLQTSINQSGYIRLENFESGAYMVHISGGQQQVRQTVIVR